MKTKSILTFLFLAFMGIASFSQNDEIKNKLKFNSFSITPFEVSTAKGLNSGLGVSLDASVSYNQNVFAFAYSGIDESSSDGWFGDFSSIRFEQYNFLYGREFLLAPKLFFDAFAGVGLFNRKWEQTDIEFTGIGFGFNADNTREYDSTFGVPIVLKLRYIFRKRFSMGIKLQANINSIANMASYGLLLQWNFN